MTIKIKDTETSSDSMVKFSNQLIRPGDITDAIDSKDLLDQIVTANVAKITKKVEGRIIVAWIEDRKARLRAEYYLKAETAYEKMWSICSSKAVGHSYRRIDVQGFSVEQCDDCKYVNIQAADSYARNTANKMNKTQIDELTKKMIEVDIEAGTFAWPVAEDYPNIVSPKASSIKNRIFG